MCYNEFIFRMLVLTAEVAQLQLSEHCEIDGFGLSFAGMFAIAHL